jgi:hypothetical protein
VVMGAPKEHSTLVTSLHLEIIYAGPGGPGGPPLQGDRIRSWFHVQGQPLRSGPGIRRDK